MQPDNQLLPVDPALEDVWGPVDLYIGGAEHATLHLLYSRFWYLALSDLGKIRTTEPFRKLVNQGLLISFSFRNSRGVLIPTDEVEERADGCFYVKKNSSHYDPDRADEPLERIKAKMSKSLRNVVTPDEVVESYGADSYRICLMFMGPVEQTREWENSKAAGAQRFLRRFWRFVTNDLPGVRATVSFEDEALETRRQVDEAAVSIAEGIETLRLNTAIAAVMKCLNQIDQEPVSRETLEKLILMLSPFAPYISLARVSWPEVDLSKYEGPANVTLAVTINGKRRGEITMPGNSTDDELTDAAISAVAERWGVASEDTRIIVVRDSTNGLPKLVNLIMR